MLKKARVKIEVYLTDEEKREILKKSKGYNLPASVYLKLKAMDLLKEKLNTGEVD
jgi:hypothetical protein